MVLIRVETDSYRAASAIFGGTIGPDLLDAAGRLSATLSGTGGMAGVDPAGTKWASAYDTAARTLGQGIMQAVGASFSMAMLLEHTGLNHARAETASTPGGGAGVADDTRYFPATCVAVTAPPAAGASGGGPPGWSLVQHLVGFVWPDGHQDLLHTAAGGWRTMATALRTGSTTTGQASVSIAQEQSPEVGAAQRVTGAVGQHYATLASGCDQLAQACDNYAAHLDTVHSQVEQRLAELLAAVAATTAVGIGISILTAGLAAPAAAGADSAEVAAAATDVGLMITDFATGVDSVASTADVALSTASEVEPALASIADANIVDAAATDASVAPTAAETAEQDALTSLEDAEQTGPGQWNSTNESMSAGSRTYQQQITGRAGGDVYRVNGVKFDGYQDGVLQDAKGPGYAKFLDSNGEFKPWYRGADDLVKQAQRQIAVSGGRPIEWSVAEEPAANAIEDLLAANGVTGINVTFVPPMGG